ncbi:hypothetical protein [Holdemanella biformis]|uniref:hypothetical protein n=1 Tax=Holdemanella biformis TaxID=1735 RepID=UPI003A9508EC
MGKEAKNQSFVGCSIRACRRIILMILNCFEDGNYAYRLLEQTVEELAKCFLLEYGDNKKFSFGRCKQGKSFNDLLCEKVDKVGSHTESHSVHH